MRSMTFFTLCAVMLALSVGYSRLIMAQMPSRHQEPDAGYPMRANDAADGGRWGRADAGYGSMGDTGGSRY